MSARRRRLLIALPLAFGGAVVVVIALGGADASAPAPAAPAAPTAATGEKRPGPSTELFQGFLMAATATDVYAPEFIFRVGGWQSDWGSRKIVELAADGKSVKKGDVVARFEFGVEDAKRRIEERIARAQGEANKARIAAAQQVEAMEMELRRKQIDAQSASLDLERERALSRRQAEGLRIMRKLAEFDVEASTQRLASRRVARAAETSFRDKQLAKENEGTERYEFYRQRFTLKAPHDGVVRHAFNSRERRKIQKGDNTGAGMKVLSLAADDALAVRFFVPEAQAAQIKIGTKLAVVVPTSAAELDAEVVAVDFFPQEIGFLLENEALPNGREKAIQVRAALSSSSSAASSGLAAGTEVRVKVRP